MTSCRDFELCCVLVIGEGVGLISIMQFEVKLHIVTFDAAHHL